MKKAYRIPGVENRPDLERFIREKWSERSGKSQDFIYVSEADLLTIDTTDAHPQIADIYTGAEPVIVTNGFFRGLTSAHLSDAEKLAYINELLEASPHGYQIHDWYEPPQDPASLISPRHQPEFLLAYEHSFLRGASYSGDPVEVERLPNPE